MASSDPAGIAERSTSRASERVIAADRVVGVQRWDIGGFDATAATRSPPPRRVAAEHLPTVDEVTAIEQSARDDGYRAGLAEARAGNERLAALLADVPVSIARMEREMAQTLLKLAIDLARQVVRESIAVRPELIVPVISEALSGIARTAEPGAIHVNPADLPIVEERLGDALEHAGWKAFGDERIERGGCLVDFASGQVDATIALRWSRVMAQLDRPDAWLE